MKPAVTGRSLVFPPCIFSESNQLSERGKRQTTWQSTWQTDRLAPLAPKVEVAGRVMCQTLSQINNVHPHTAGCLQAPVPRSKGQMTCPTTPFFSSPREQRARVVIKPTPPPAVSPRIPPGRHRLHLLSHSSSRKGERAEEEGTRCSEGHRNLDCTSLATGRERGTNKPTWGKGNKQTHPGEDFST